MRRRLRTAVKALLADPSVLDLPDAARAAAVLLMAKAGAETAQTSIWAAELGRWLGVSESHIDHAVLPALRNSGAMQSQVIKDRRGYPRGLACSVVPLHDALHRTGTENHGPGHPLRLSKAELAVLLRLCEALFGPGWTPREGPSTPPGLLATRTGRGAATDRLALLLLVLESRPSGWLPLCPGAIKKTARKGRPAATVARILGCGLAGGAGVLSRLQAAGLVEVSRAPTPSGLKGRSRVRVLPVAAANQKPVSDRTPSSRMWATPRHDSTLGMRPDSVQVPEPDNGHRHDNTSTIGSSERIHAAPRDRARHVRSESPRHSGSAASRGLNTSARPARSAATPHHTHHASGVPVSSKSAGGWEGFSSHTSADQTQDIHTQNPRQPPNSTGDTKNPKTNHPLRGEKQHQVPPLQVSDPSEVAYVLRPVIDVFERISRHSSRSHVQAAVQHHLSELHGVVGKDSARSILAQRVSRRLDAQGGAVFVRDPVGWLLKKALPRRPGCYDLRCDESLRVDTQLDCPSCQLLIEDRRTVRVIARTSVDEQLPGLSTEARRNEIDVRTRQAWLLEESRFKKQWEDRKALLQHRQAELTLRAERERQEAKEREDLACVDCRKPKSSGLCTVCADFRAVEVAVQRAVDLVVASHADLTDPSSISMVSGDAERSVRAQISSARAEIDRSVAAEELPSSIVSLESLAARLAAQGAERACHGKALATLAMTEPVLKEAGRVHQRVLISQRGTSRYDGWQKAAETAWEAGRRGAKQLLKERMAQLSILKGTQLPPQVSQVSDPYVAGVGMVRAAMSERRMRREIASPTKV